MASAESTVLTFLLNAAWQVPVVVAVGTMLAGALRRTPARTKHQLWMLVLGVAVVLPAISAIGPRARPFRPTSAVHRAQDPSVRQAGAAPAFDWPMAIEVPRPRGHIGALMVLLWALSTGLRALRLGRAARQVLQLRASARGIEARADLVALVARSCRAFGLSRVVVLRTTTLSGPVTMGIRRQAVLLPESLLAHASPKQLDAVVLHEMAHVARRDCLWHLVSEIALLPISFHPATWWLHRRLAMSREMACDEEAAARSSGPLLYARSLFEVAARVAGFDRPFTTLGALGAPALEVRMRRLIDDLPLWSPRSARAALLAAGMILGLTYFSASAFALGVSTQGDTAYLAAPGQFAGTWRGLYDEGEGNGLPGVTLTVSLVDGQPRAALILHRHLKNGDGTVTSTAVGLPVLEQRLENGALEMRTRDDNFRFLGGAKESVDLEWRFVLMGKDEGELRVLASSYFAPAKKRGVPVPPPPPAMHMTRER